MMAPISRRARKIVSAPSLPRGNSSSKTAGARSGLVARIRRLEVEEDMAEKKPGVRSVGRSFCGRIPGTTPRVDEAINSRFFPVLERQAGNRTRQALPSESRSRLTTQLGAGASATRAIRAPRPRPGRQLVEESPRERRLGLEA